MLVRYTNPVCHCKHVVRIICYDILHFSPPVGASTSFLWPWPINQSFVTFWLIYIFTQWQWPWRHLINWFINLFIVAEQKVRIDPWIKQKVHNKEKGYNVFPLTCILIWGAFGQLSHLLRSFILLPPFQITFLFLNFFTNFVLKHCSAVFRNIDSWNMVLY